MRPLVIGQSADPDDAFMAWGLQKELARRGIEARLLFDDIESLNRAAASGELDMTALSVGAYPAVASSYRMLRSGASFGEEYGPIVVARGGHAAGRAALAGRRVAIPGSQTTARLLLRLLSGASYTEVEMPFDRILDAVIDGEVDAGLVIHEGQLVYEDMGLRLVFEPAREWTEREGLPVPLGVVVVSRSLPADLQRSLADAFLHSVHAAFRHPEDALDFAAQHARGLDRERLETYVRRYVDAATLDMGQAGERAIRRLFELAVAAEELDTAPPLDLI